MTLLSTTLLMSSRPCRLACLGLSRGPCPALARFHAPSQLLLGHPTEPRPKIRHCRQGGPSDCQSVQNTVLENAPCLVKYAKARLSVAPQHGTVHAEEARHSIAVAVAFVPAEKPDFCQ